MSVKLVSRDGYFVHPTAEVDPMAVVGSGTRIFHHAQVMGGARVGKGCTIGRSSCIHDGVVLGDGCNIQNYITIPEGVVLEDRVFCPAHTVFTNVHNPRAAVSRKHEYRQTYVEHDVSFGANSTAVCGVRIGAYAMIGAGAVVTKDVKPHALVVGVPARQAGWVTRTGIVFKNADLELSDGARIFACDEEPGVVYVVNDDDSVEVRYRSEEPSLSEVAREAIVVGGSLFHDGTKVPATEEYDKIDQMLTELDEGGPNGPVAQQQRARIPISIDDDSSLDGGDDPAHPPSFSLFLSKRDPGEEAMPTPMYSRVWDPLDEYPVHGNHYWSCEAIVYAGRVHAARAGERYWRRAFEKLKKRVDEYKAERQRPTREPYDPADELDAIKLGTAEEERVRAKCWMSDAARYCKDADYWREKYEAICEEMSAPFSYEVPLSTSGNGKPAAVSVHGHRKLSPEEQDELETRMSDIAEGLR